MAACEQQSASSQSLRFTLSLRMNSSFITSRHGSKLIDTLIMFLIFFVEKASFEKNQQTTTKSWKIAQHAKSLLKHSWHLCKTKINRVSRLENYFSYFSTKTYVVGTQKNCLTETSYEHPKQILRMRSKKKLLILRSIFLLTLT